MCLIRIIRVEVWPYDGIKKMGSQVDDLCVLSSTYMYDHKKNVIIEHHCTIFFRYG